MSERMIELARARMNLPPAPKQQPSMHTGTPNPFNTMNGGSMPPHSATAASQVHQRHPNSTGVMGMHTTSRGNLGGMSTASVGGLSTTSVSASRGGGSAAAAASVLENEDAGLDQFLCLIADQSSASAAAVSASAGDQADAEGSAALAGPSSASFTTVPLSLSRRMLNVQGVGFADDNVAAITSIAADRFLATILSQSVVCRDRRIRGEEMRKQLRRERKEYRRQRRRERRERYESRERKRRKKMDSNRRLVEANATLVAYSTGQLQGGFALANEGAQRGKSKKSKKESAVAATNAASAAALATLVELTAGKKEDGSATGVGATPENGGKPAESGAASADPNKTGDESEEDDESSEEPFSDEEYDMFLSDTSSEDDDDDDDENDQAEEAEEERRQVLHLRDVVRPLEAWGVSLAGKADLCPGPTPARKRRRKRRRRKDGGLDDDRRDGEDGGDGVVAGAGDGDGGAAGGAASSAGASSAKDEERSPSRGPAEKKDGGK